MNSPKLHCLETVRLFALDPYDLALARLERNLPRDRCELKTLGEDTLHDVGRFLHADQLLVEPLVAEGEGVVVEAGTMVDVMLLDQDF